MDSRSNRMTQEQREALANILRESLATARGRGSSCVVSQFHLEQAIEGLTTDMLPARGEQED